MKVISWCAILGMCLSLTSIAAEKRVLFVVMGGYTSCPKNVKGPVAYGTGLYPQFSEMAKRLKSSRPDLKISYVASCLYSAAPPNGEGSFVTSREPDRDRTGNASVLLNEIEDIANREQTSSVYLMGHSYGAWLGMYLIENLRMKAPITGLATIDPIGPACGPSSVIFGGKACKQAPTDRDNKRIRSAVGKWINLYQTQDSWLHSSAIKEAENFKIEYRGPHTSIDDDTRTWAEIERMVAATL